MDATLAALLGAIIGGVLSVVASWLAQRVQTKSQWLSQEIARRQLLYSEFLDAAVCCYGDALEHDEVDTAAVSKLYGEMGRMRLNSSEPVLLEAYGSFTNPGDLPQRQPHEIRSYGPALARRDQPLTPISPMRAAPSSSSLQPLRLMGDAPLSFRPVPDMPSEAG